MRRRAYREQRCDGVLRRDLLRVGALTALGLGLGDLLRLRRVAAVEPESVHAAGRAKSCILIWLDGGPSHLETFDPKPEAPAEVRGPLDTIATAIPGIRFSECLPRTAAMLDRLAVVRSVTSPLGEHNFGTHYLMTGYKPTPVLEYPTFGGVLAHIRGGAQVLPPHVAVPDFRVGGGRFSGGGFLPAAVRPFAVGGDPGRPEFTVRDLEMPAELDLTRLDRRRGFVQALDAFHQRAIDSRGTIETAGAMTDPDLQRAFDLITSPEAKAAFRLSDEPAAVRQRYGGKSIGQCCLLARRLVERGVSFVTVNDRGWDTHADLYTRLKEGYTGAKIGVGLVPSLDLALAALIGDLDDRGLLEDTLVVVMGEFGRTPKLNAAGGRDHWPRVFSVLLAGGGVAGGQVIGSSDAVGESPRDRAVTPADLAATIYTLLGIDPQLELQTRDGRPVRVTSSDARPLREIVG